MSKEQCPVCHRRVMVSAARVVEPHHDKTMKTGCPMTGKQYPLGLYEDAS